MSALAAERLFELWDGKPQLIDPTLWKSTVWGIKPHGDNEDYLEVQISLESYMDEEGNLYRPEKGADYDALVSQKVILRLYAAICKEQIPEAMVEASGLPEFRAWVQWKRLAVRNVIIKKNKKGLIVLFSSHCFIENAEFHGTGSGRGAFVYSSIEEIMDSIDI